MGTPLVIGVLGGIASGKSLVARLLVAPDGFVISADEIAHEVLASDAVTERVRAEFGDALLGTDGRPDRAALGRLVFADPAAREKLEGWTHPAVRARIGARLEEARRANVTRVALDVPLLLENDDQHGLARVCEALVFVESDAQERERRAVQSRGWEPGEVARREAFQMPLEEKRERADYIVSNTGTLDELKHAVAEVLAALSSRS